MKFITNSELIRASNTLAKCSRRLVGLSLEGSDGSAEFVMTRDKEEDFQHKQAISKHRGIYYRVQREMDTVRNHIS